MHPICQLFWTLFLIDCLCLTKESALLAGCEWKFQQQNIPRVKEGRKRSLQDHSTLKKSQAQRISCFEGRSSVRTFFSSFCKKRIHNKDSNFLANVCTTLAFCSSRSKKMIANGIGNENDIDRFLGGLDCLAFIGLRKFYL